MLFFFNNVHAYAFVVTAEFKAFLFEFNGGLQQASKQVENSICTSGSACSGLSECCGGVRARLSHAFTASPPFPDMADDALRLCDLPADLLSRIAYLMACPVKMARTSQACRLLR